MTARGESMSCPFCKQADFDAIGLKVHIARGWCDAYEAVVVFTHLQMSKGMNYVNASEGQIVEIAWWIDREQKWFKTSHTCPPKATRDAARDANADGTSDGRGRAQAGEQPRDGD